MKHQKSISDQRWTQLLAAIKFLSESMYVYKSVFTLIGLHQI